MHHCINILGTDYVVDFDYKITAKGCPARGPSYASGGEPADPMEYEITLDSIYFDGIEPFAELEVPAWLQGQITEFLQADSAVYDKIAADGF